MNRRWIVLLAALLLPAVAWAQAPAPQVKAVRMSVHPAVEPVPSLRYTLLPSMADQTDGNAAVLYERAAVLAAQHSAGATSESLLRLLETPLDKLTGASVPLRDSVHEVELAVHRRRVDWDLPLSEGYALLLPELSPLRDVGKALAVKARMEIASGRPDAAIATLQAGLGMSRDLAKAPLLINALVGIATARVMLDRVEELEQRPDAPSLYWALTALPRPLVSTRRGLEFEGVALGIWNPALLHPARTRLSPEGWRQVFLDFKRQLDPELGVTSTKFDDLWTAGAALATYTDAKKRLLAQGYKPEQVEAMPVLQVVAIYMMDGYRRLFDTQARWYFVPYWQARAHLNDGEDALRRARRDKDAFLAELLMPALGKAYEQQILLDRRVDVLRCVEAIRLYAAANDGRLPASLADIKQVPVPLDPVTNEPFGYELEDATAVLSGPPADERRPDTALRYEITIAK